MTTWWLAKTRKVIRGMGLGLDQTKRQGNGVDYHQQTEQVILSVFFLSLLRSTSKNFVQ